MSFLTYPQVHRAIVGTVTEDITWVSYAVAALGNNTLAGVTSGATGGT